MTDTNDDRIAEAATAPEPISSDLPLFADYAIRWLESRNLDIKASTKVDYASQLRNHVIPRWGAYRLDEIRTLEIREWVKELRQNPKLAPRTILNIYGLLRNVMSEAVADELIQSNPCCLKARHLPPNESLDPDFGANHVFSHEELLRIIDHPSIPCGSHCLYVMLFATGVRIGEALALTWDDVMIDDDIPWLRVNKSYSSKTDTVGSTKTGASKRIPIHPRLEDALYRWIVEYHTAVGCEPTGERLVFPARRGGSPTKHMRSSVVYHDFQRELSALGMPRRRVHDARRTFATLAANTPGVDSETIKRVTHPKPSDVAGTYREIPVAVLHREIVQLDLGKEGGDE